jgi:hypothetical protein
MLCVCMRAYVCVCVCVRARECERESKSIMPLETTPQPHTLITNGGGTNSFGDSNANATEY